MVQTLGREAIEEKELIGKIQKGNLDLYAELVKRHQTYLFQLCLAILRDPLEAEEAAQVTFIKAYRALESFKLASAFRTWLTRIGLNHCRDVLRTKKNHRFLSLEGLMEEGRLAPAAESGPEPETPEPLPALTPQMLEALSEGERQVLGLFKDRGGQISYEEMARELGLTLDGVKGRLKRARVKLQKLLEINGKKN